MVKRCSALLIALVLLLCTSSSSFACDEEQTDTYITQVLFGYDALSKENDENVKKLQKAVYICCEQCDGSGQEKLDYLKTHKVSGLPELAKIDIDSDELLECSHNSWEYEYADSEKAQTARKKVLQKTVNDVFDFGFFNNHFGSSKGKCNSFAALLYYTHILSDYLADHPEKTEVSVGDKVVPAYSGSAYTIVNGDKPSFSKNQMNSTEAKYEFSDLDDQGRAGSAFANIGIEIMPPSSSRQNIGMMKPSGWNQNRYDDILGSDKAPGYLYQRCHLIAHQLVGGDDERNIITGTQYLNNSGMKPFEDEVARYIKTTNNHVLYRVTPIFQGDNMVASGVQIEAYSIEDKGAGISCNRYYYNVQPGIDLNYANGENSLSDEITNSEEALPFAVENPNEDNPDLIYEMDKHIKVLFEDQSDSNTYTRMMENIKTISNEARAVNEDNPAKKYMQLKKYEYQYFDVLKIYIPMMLEKEDFFTSAFN